MYPNIQLDLMKSSIITSEWILQQSKSEYFTDFASSQNAISETWDDGIGVFSIFRQKVLYASDTYIQNHIMYESPFSYTKPAPVISKGVF